MRISDRLTENIIIEVMERDRKSDFLKKRGEEKGVYLKRLIAVINSLGITFSVWEKNNADGKGSGTYEWTSLIGSDKKKLLHLLPTQLESRDILFPETKETVIKTWRDFESLISKAGKRVGMLGRLRRGLRRESANIVYCSLIRPI